MKRCAIIGMSGNSLFFDYDNKNKKLVHEEVGGKGYNQAIACIRNGIKVSYLSAIGNDEIGNKLEKFMQDEGIDTFFVRKNKPTLEAQILVDREGNNQVIYDQNNVSCLDKEDVINFENEIKKSDCLLLQFEYDKEVIEEAIKLAKKHQKLIVINPAPMIYPDIELIKEADIITPNELEAKTLFDIDGKNSFNELIIKEQKSPFQLVINTIGDKGILLVEKEEYCYFNPIKVNPIDTTGAGDTFNGVFIATYLKTENLIESIKRGIVGSGLSVTKKYVMDAIPNEKIIDDYIKNNNVM